MDDNIDFHKDTVKTQFDWRKLIGKGRRSTRLLYIDPRKESSSKILNDDEFQNMHEDLYWKFGIQENDLENDEIESEKDQEFTKLNESTSQRSFKTSQKDMLDRDNEIIENAKKSLENSNTSVERPALNSDEYETLDNGDDEERTEHQGDDCSNQCTSSDRKSQSSMVKDASDSSEIFQNKLSKESIFKRKSNVLESGKPSNDYLESDVSPKGMDKATKKIDASYYETLLEKSRSRRTFQQSESGCFHKCSEKRSISAPIYTVYPSTSDQRKAFEKALTPTTRSHAKMFKMLMGDRCVLGLSEKEPNTNHDDIKKNCWQKYCDEQLMKKEKKLQSFEHDTKEGKQNKTSSLGSLPTSQRLKREEDFSFRLGAHKSNHRFIR